MKIKKTLYTLNVDNYAPRICDLTYPLLKRYADKIGAEFHVINQRRYQKWPVTYEKLQIFDLAREHANDWNIYIDSDAIVHPETIDFTELLPRDTVMHNGCDFAGVRWRYDDYFRRDGRNIGSCNWLAIASSMCLDLWHPLEDMTPEQAVANIIPTVNEDKCGITADHLVDDYTLSRNIARFGLKFTTAMEIQRVRGLPEANFFWHAYTIPVDEKVVQMREVLKKWNLADLPALKVADRPPLTVIGSGG